MNISRKNAKAQRKTGSDLRIVKPARHPGPAPLNERDLRLLQAIQNGLPLCSRPYAEIGARMGLDEGQVISRLEKLLAGGIIKRMGVVVRHHELGYRANAMVVWDVPDEEAAYLGRCLSNFEFVTLCYRRARVDGWRYNLYCMIHGQDRRAVLDKLAFLIDACGIHDLPRAVLFSRRRFKQRGAMYLPSVESPRAGAGKAERQMAEG